MAIPPYDPDPHHQTMEVQRTSRSLRCHDLLEIREQVLKLTQDHGLGDVQVHTGHFGVALAFLAVKEWPLIGSVSVWMASPKRQARASQGRLALAWRFGLAAAFRPNGVTTRSSAG